MTTVATGQVLLAGSSPAGFAASFAAPSELAVIRPEPLFHRFEDNQCMSLPFGVKLLGIEANLPLLKRLEGRYSHKNEYWKSNPSCSPESLGPSPALGTHPDAIEWLWDHIHSRLPESRRWVVLGTPALVNPDSEIVFAFAAGTFYALRLPTPTREAALAAGAVGATRTGALSPVLSMLGDEWVRGMFARDAEERWQSAFEYSAILANS